MPGRSSTNKNPSKDDKQFSLFEAAPALELVSPSNERSIFNDPAFASNKTLPIHRWVPWIAGFSSSFVKDALNRYLDGKGTILDPFAGVGTTLVEGALLGHNGIGFEINPYAASACRVKVNAYQIALEKLYDEIHRFQTFYDGTFLMKETPQSKPPKGFKTREAFYSPQVLHKVLIVQDFINTIQDTALQDLFRLAFVSTMVRYSNYSYEPSLGRRVSAGKENIEDFHVSTTILYKLTEMAEDIRWVQTHLPHGSVQVKIINNSFFQYRTYLPPQSADLIVTSPPYLNN